MAGREDFGIVRSQLLTDPRAHAVAAAYVEKGIAAPDTALSAVIGHVAMLGIWAMRETDNGALPGDAVVTIMAATMVNMDTAVCIRDSFVTEKLLKRKGRKATLFLAGFRDCYAPIINRRDRNRRNAKAVRSKASVGDVGGDVGAHVSGDVVGDVSDYRNQPEQTGTDHNPPIRRAGGVELRSGGAEARNGKPLTERQIVTVVAILECLCGGAGGVAAQQNALDWRKANRRDRLDYAVARELMDRYGSQFSKTIAKALKEAGL